MTAIIAAIIPLLVKIIFSYMEKKDVDAANKKKFLEAVQSIDALRSTNMKKSFDALVKELETPTIK